MILAAAFQVCLPCRETATPFSLAHGGLRQVAAAPLGHLQDAPLVRHPQEVEVDAVDTVVLPEKSDGWSEYLTDATAMPARASRRQKRVR